MFNKTAILTNAEIRKNLGGLNIQDNYKQAMKGLC